jgi:hypothetical protein
MAETLTRSEGQIVLDDIKKEIKRIEGLIRDKKVGGATIEILDEKKTKLQVEIDKILKKGGVITEEDYNKAYNLIRGQEEKELLDLSQKAKDRMILYAIVGIGVVAAYIYLIKKK